MLQAAVANLTLFYLIYLANAFYTGVGDKNAPYLTPKPRVMETLNLACGWRSPKPFRIIGFD